MPAIRLCAAALAAAAVPTALAAVASPASADPKGGTVVISCDNGRTYEATTSKGNGEFTPAHDTASTTVLIPTSFRGFSYTITDAQGNVLDSGSDNSVTVKGNGNAEKARATATSCTYTFTETSMDPQLGLVTFAGTGAVMGFTTPAR